MTTKRQSVSDLLWAALLVVVLTATPGTCSPQNPNFSGGWNLDNERSVPRSSGDITLHIDQRDSEMTVETTIARGSAAPRHAVQRYTTDGMVSKSIGADGDEFYTSIVWSGQSPIFSIEEHEDGRIILSKESWTLIENGAALQRVREPADASPDGAGKQTMIYLRQAPRT